jgi:[protein-PII] uridylyltransferase
MAAPSIDSHISPVPKPDEDAAELAKATRAYLSEVREFLAEQSREGASGAAVNMANSDAFDRLLRRIAERVEAEHYAEVGTLGSPVAIAAVGGYARREMSISSDVDLLFLVSGKVDDYAERLVQRVQYGLWDAGVELGAAIRTIDECIALGRDDVTARTALLGARFLAGDSALFHRLGTAVRDRLIPNPEAFVNEQAEAFRDRHDRFGESLYLLQPNLKEGAGGLRDYHVAMWVARAADPNVRDLQDFLNTGLLSESELVELRKGLDFLWRVRNALHLLPGRKTDQLTFELQEQLAGGFGYAEEESNELPVERLMRDYYQSARAIQTYSEIIIEQCQVRVKRKAKRRKIRDVEDGFRIVGDHLEIPHAAHLRERPVRLLTAFAVAQEEDVALSRTAERLVREQLDLVDDDFRSGSEARDALLRVLANEHRVMRSLMTMNEVGLLARYLPEWEHIVCRWQHVIYHTYTVDVHSIFLVEQLRRLGKGEYEDTSPDLTYLVRNARDKPALFLGCLLHDIGKGYGAADHSAHGVGLARTCLERLGLEPERTARALFIVEAHLLMSHIAQRRDLSDPKVVVEFARRVGDRENLHNLYLATFADMRASSEAGWTPWRRQLLRELFERTSEFLEAGEDDPRRAAEQVEARVERRREAAVAEMGKKQIEESTALGYLDGMPRRYFIAHTPQQIARHAEVAFKLSADQPIEVAVREMGGGFSELIVCSSDHPGLYGQVSGSITAAGVNILGSNAYTTRAGVALEVYRVTTPSGGDEERHQRWRQLEEILRGVLAGTLELDDVLARRRAPIGVRRIPSRTPPSVSIRNDVSDFYTVVDLTSDDRLGLLFDVTRTLADHKLEIFISKATTVLDQVADTFYVKGPDLDRVTDPDQLAALEAALLEVLQDDSDG